MSSLSVLERRQRDTMRMLRTYIDRSPVAAVTARALLSLSEDSKNLPEEVERLAAADPTLAMKMLYLANHSFFGMPDAGVTLGSLLSHVGASAVLTNLRDRESTVLIEPSRVVARDLWNHSRNVAAVAAHFCGHAPILGIRPAEGYLAGLIHDLGRFVMMTTAPDAFDRIENAEWRGGDALIREEIEVMGFDHASLGWLASRTWNFPDSLAAVCKFHHEWSTFDASRYSSRTATMVRLVGLADEIVFVWERDPNSARDIGEVLGAGEYHFRHFYGSSVMLGSPDDCERILSRRNGRTLMTRTA